MTFFVHFHGTAWAFGDAHAAALAEHRVDHVAVAQGLGCKALRVFEPNDIQPALRKAQELIKEFRVPVVVEIILERVTNISMGTEINAVNEFEDLALVGNDAPTAISMLD